MIKYTASVAETMHLGEALGKRVEKGTTVCLTGDLGTGKTHFAKGFALGMGIRDHITSPTFTIVNEYHEGRLPFYHFDVYRVHDADEILDIGFEEYVFGQGVTLIEWADLIESILPDSFIHVNLEKTENPDERKITIRGVGQEFDYLKELE